MNNGDSHYRKEPEKTLKRSKASKFYHRSDNFALGIAKVATAQVCESVGFQGFQNSALEALSDIVVRYIHRLGKSASFNANFAGRGEVNVFDVFQGLEELGSGLGFAGASDVDRCMVSSGVVRDIVHFVGAADNVPFAYDVPQFPVVKDGKGLGSSWEKQEEPPGEHVPSWLPVFPDPETYADRLNVGNEMMNGEKSEFVRGERKMEQSLLNLQQRFGCSGNEDGSSHDGGEVGKTREAVESNPYLAAPLHFGEKEVEVSPVVLPSKFSNEVALANVVPENSDVRHHVSVLETFAPAIEAMRSGSFDSSIGHNKVLHNQRPTVHFKIGIGKKSLGIAPDLDSKHKSLEKIASWFENDNEKDDKKRRAEKILKESMENTQELAQL